jgi:hypothetical protein
VRDIDTEFLMVFYKKISYKSKAYVWKNHWCAIVCDHSDMYKNRGGGDAAMAKEKFSKTSK